MIMIIFPIFFLISNSLIFSKRIKLDFNYSLPIVTAITVICLYLFCALDWLKEFTIGYYAVAFIAFVHFLRKEHQQFFAKIIENRNEIILFFLVVFIFAVVNKNAVLSSWDDFTFWGPASKELLLKNSFEKIGEPSGIATWHAHYPRGAPLFHYFLLYPVGYSDNMVLTAHLILHLIFLLPLAGNKNIRITSFFIFTILTIAVMYTTAIRSIYNDSTTGLIFASTIAIAILGRQRDNQFHLIPILVFMPLFREIGLVLSLISSLIIVFSLSEKSNARNKILFLILAISLPYLALSSWYEYFMTTHEAFERKQHSFSTLIELAQTFDYNKYLIALAFIKAWAKLMIFSSTLITIVIIGTAYKTLKKHSEFLTKHFIRTNLYLIVGFLVFCIWRLYLYYFAYSENEAIRAASISRYLGSYLLVFSVVSCAYLKEVINLKNILNKKANIIISVIAIIGLFIVCKHTTRIRTDHNSNYKVSKEVVTQIRLLLSENKPIIFDYSDKSSSLDCQVLNYLLLPYFTKQELIKCLNYDSNSNNQELKNFDHNQVISVFK